MFFGGEKWQVDAFGVWCGSGVWIGYNRMKLIISGGSGCEWDRGGVCELIVGMREKLLVRRRGTSFGD